MVIPFVLSVTGIEHCQVSATETKFDDYSPSTRPHRGGSCNASVPITVRNTTKQGDIMLVVTRKPGQLLLIEPRAGLPKETTVGDIFADGPIQIVVGKIDRHQVRLGIDAPASLGVWRQELGACPARKPRR